MELKRKIRTVPMQVLALGMSRSGTESMRKALEELGYQRTYHGVRDLMNSRDGFIWEELTQRKYGPNPQPITSEHLDWILGDCAAVTDMPCVAFWSELMDAYPEAKIVLVDRDVETWYRSFNHIVTRGVFSWRSDLLVYFMRLGLLPKFVNNFIFVLYLKYFQAKTVTEMDRNARTVYKQHYADITARAEAEGRPLLRMRIEDARWKPLCEFLGKEVPNGRKDEKLPKGNERHTTAARTRNYQLLALAVVGIELVALAGIPVAAAFWYTRWRP